ncbi:MobC family replication-relaxation protein [Shewanella colwelliana]|uniref:MobC family replication-relaxation protein n=1 Tax=Shewanella colwelliana TaxID=23 RepID=UPI00373639B0
MIPYSKNNKARHAQKKQSLLNFLKEETYSDLQTLMSILKIKNRCTMSRFLPSMIEQGLLQKYAFPLPGNKSISIWGITREGLVYAQALDDPLEYKHFQPSKIRLSSLHHHLENQKVKLRLESLGCTGWLNGDKKQLGAKFPLKHRPDGYIKLTNNMPIVIETELFIKSKLRYKEIILHHLLARNKKQWYYVLYVMPDLNKKAALQRIFNSVDHVIYQGRKLDLDNDHRNIFKIHTLEEVQTLKLTEIFGAATR